MKRKLKTVCLLSITSLLGGLLAGCGGKKDDGKLTIHFWHTFGQGIVDELNRKITSFTKLIKDNEGIDVEISLDYQGGYDDILSKVQKGFAVGNAPTMTVAYPDHVANFLQYGDTPGQYVVNLDDYIGDSEIGLGKEAFLGDTTGIDDFVSGFINEGKQYILDGTYSMPFMKSTEVLFYNKDAMEAVFSFYDPSIKGENIDKFLANMSWETFMDICQTVMDNKDKISTSIEHPAVYDSDSNMFISQLSQADIDFLSIKDGQPVLSFDCAEAKAIVADLKADYDKGLFATKGTLGTYGSDEFVNGKSLFSIGSSGGSGYNLPTGGSFEVGIAKVPARKNNPKYVTQGPTIALLRNDRFSAAKNDQLIKYAWKFLKYITSTQNNVDLCLASEGYVPVRESSYVTDDYKVYLAEGEMIAESASVVVNDVAGKYLTTPVFKGSATARDEVGGIITQVLLGNKTVDKAFTDAVNQTKLQM